MISFSVLQSFARFVFQNQHKLIQQLLQTQQLQIRLCSGGSQQIQHALRVEEDDAPRISQADPVAAPFPMKLEHAPDVGEQFRVSTYASSCDGLTLNLNGACPFASD